MKKFLTLACLAYLFLAPNIKLLAGPASYLDLDPATRPSGMGSAFTALADDSNAVLFNPAGLTNMDVNSFEAAGSIGFLSQDRFSNFLGLSQQLEHKQFIGFDLTQYGVGNIPGTDLNGLSGLSLQDMEIAFGAAYAYEFNYHFKVGLRASFLYQDLTGVSARGFGGADLGILYVPSVLYDFTLGATLRHLGGFLSWDTGNNEMLAPDIRLGACLKLFDRALALVYDVEKTFQTGSSLIHRVGSELWIEKAVALRCGMDNENPTMGASARYENYGLDYSYEFEQQGLGDSQRIAAGLFF